TLQKVCVVWPCITVVVVLTVPRGAVRSKQMRGSRWRVGTVWRGRKSGRSGGSGWSGRSGWSDAPDSPDLPDRPDPPAPPDLLDEQHLSIRRQGPNLVRNLELELVARLPQRDHRRNHLVAIVLRMLCRVAVAFVLELFLQLVGRALEVVHQ